jgi:O-antigen/teichoic acid export membrane protein
VTPRLVRNAFATFSGQVVTWGLTAVTLMLVPRYLGPSGAGVVNIGWTYATVVAIFATLGLNTLLTREVARDRHRASRDLPSAIWLVVSLGVLGAGAAVGLALAAGYTGDRILGVAVWTAAVPAIVVSSLCVATLQGLEAMARAAALDVVSKATMLVMALLVILVDGGLLGILLTWTVVSYLVAAAQVTVVHRHYPFRLWSVSWKTALRLTRWGLPFFLISVFWVLYSSVEVVLIAHFGTDADVSYFAVPLRVFGAMLFVPVTVATVMYPRLTAMHATDPASLPRMVDQTLRLVVALSVPIALAGIAMSGAGVELLLGSEFADAGPVVTILAVSLIPTAVSTVAGRIAFATDQQRKVAIIGFWAFLAKVGVGLLLIPMFEAKWGAAAMGAAVALVIAELGMVAVITRLVPREALRQPGIGRFYTRLSLATVAATTVLIFLWSVIGTFGAALLAFIVYAALVHALDVYRVGFLFRLARAAVRRQAAGG